MWKSRYAPPEAGEFGHPPNRLEVCRTPEPVHTSMYRENIDWQKPKTPFLTPEHPIGRRAPQYLAHPNYTSQFLEVSQYKYPRDRWESQYAPEWAWNQHGNPNYSPWGMASTLPTDYAGNCLPIAPAHRWTDDFDKRFFDGSAWSDSPRPDSCTFAPSWMDRMSVPTDSRWSSNERRGTPPRSVATPANSPRRSTSRFDSNHTFREESRFDTSRDSVREATQRYETAIHRAAKERQWQKAVKILSEMNESNSCSPTVRAYTSAISACAKVGQSQRALELLEEMKVIGVAPNVLTYSAAISACEKARKCKLALSLLQEMRKNHIEPDVISYNAAISACEKARKWKHALALIKEMREEAGVRPDVISYSAAISACEKAGKLENALVLLQEMKDQHVKPDVILYNATISACDKRGAWRQAVGLIREMRTHDVKPDVISYSTAISACNRGGEAEHAVKLLHEMRDANIEPNGMAFVSAISACAKQQLHGMSVELLQEMKVMGFKYEDGGEWKKASSMVRKMASDVGGKVLEDLECI